MELFDAICGRRSIRRFTPQLIDKIPLNNLLQAAVAAPSGGNRQPWRFLVVTDPRLLDLVRKLAPGRRYNAPAIIVVCYPPEGEVTRPNAETGGKGECFIPAQNIVLAAHGLGLGACLVTSFSQAALREVLSIPPDVTPVVMIAVGHPDESPKARPRKCITELAYQDQYGKQWQM